MHHSKYNCKPLWGATFSWLGSAQKETFIASSKAPDPTGSIGFLGDRGGTGGGTRILEPAGLSHRTAGKFNVSGCWWILEVATSLDELILFWFGTHPPKFSKLGFFSWLEGNSSRLVCSLMGVSYGWFDWDPSICCMFSDDINTLSTFEFIALLQYPSPPYWYFQYLIISKIGAFNVSY